ncbi:hypothetical protein MRX96_000156 [Rhipicephalus microplus]
MKLLRYSNKPFSQLSRRISELRYLSHNDAKKAQQQVLPGDCFLLKDGPVLVGEIMGDEFKGGILPYARDFFKVPLKSSELDILCIDTFSNKTKVWPLQELQNTAQCLGLCYKRGHVVLPLLHT